MLLGALGALMLHGAETSSALPPGFQPLAKQFCVECHNAEKTEGEIDLEALLAQPEKLFTDAKLLELLRDAVRDGDMPPKKAKKELGHAERARLAGLFDGALTDDEHTLLAGLYREARAQRLSFDSAVKSPLLVALASPHFVYRGGALEAAGQREGGKERQREEPVSPSLRPTVPLSSSQLATRLSFFLWASIPDDELLALAAADKLRDPHTLRVQVRRMLCDPRAQSLATDFAGQLWDFAGFEHFTGPDAKRFKEFTPALRQAMLDEVTHFLADLIANDRPLAALLDADYTFANHELARHYGLGWEDNRTTRQSDTEKARISPPFI
jgi:hypothetical protein